MNGIAKVQYYFTLIKGPVWRGTLGDLWCAKEWIVAIILHMTNLTSICGVHYLSSGILCRNKHRYQFFSHDSSIVGSFDSHQK